MRTTWVVLLVAAACVPIDAATRTERGPLLRTFERPSVVGTTLEATAALAWPSLTVTVTQVDTCRRELVEEYVEERITERSAPAAGAALATGLAGTLGAGALVLASLALSPTPDYTLIDAAGRFGPSLRQQVQGVAVVAGVVGLPALVAGLIGVLRSGVSSQVGRLEQVVSQRDGRCAEAPAAGQLVVELASGTRAPVATLDGGVATLSASAAAQGVEALFVDERPVTLSGEAGEVLEAFVRCAKRLSADGGVPEGGCGRAAAAPASVGQGYQEALAQASPRLVLAVGSADLALLDGDAGLPRVGALARGVVEGPATAEGVALRVGTRRLWLTLPAARPWGLEAQPGDEVEAVVMLEGARASGAPVGRVLWLRAAGR